MDAVRLSTTIARPPEEVFEYLADVANHPEFTDHFLIDWHLTREDSYGLGAGARFRVKTRADRFAYGDITLAEVTPPVRIVAPGRGGRFNRVLHRTTWTLKPDERGNTLVEFCTESEPKMPSDLLMEKLLRTRSVATRRHKRALDRLRSILEAGEQRGARVTLSGGARKPATGFRL
ncbi:MAG: SRPBCC family protein [Actinomycetota bacterium]|nr:SRPBCC family protein [Actinomycetota bacterium]